MRRTNRTIEAMIEEHENDPSYLIIGDRVQINACGLKRYPSCGQRQGTVVGAGSANSLRVKFDDRVSIQAIYRGHLERVPAMDLNEVPERSPCASGGNEKDKGPLASKTSARVHTAFCDDGHIRRQHVSYLQVRNIPSRKSA